MYLLAIIQEIVPLARSLANQNWSITTAREIQGARLAAPIVRWNRLFGDERSRNYFDSAFRSIEEFQWAGSRTKLDLGSYRIPNEANSPEFRQNKAWHARHSSEVPLRFTRLHWYVISSIYFKSSCRIVRSFSLIDKNNIFWNIYLKK
jgi:hypothetical protein